LNGQHNSTPWWNVSFKTTVIAGPTFFTPRAGHVGAEYSLPREQYRILLLDSGLFMNPVPLKAVPCGNLEHMPILMVDNVGTFKL
jgi:hypothetical protein